MKKWISNILILLNIVQVAWATRLLIHSWMSLYVPWVIILSIYIALSIVGIACARGFGRNSTVTIITLIIPLSLLMFFVWLSISWQIGLIY